MAEINRAKELDPIYLDNGMGVMFYHLRRFDEAIDSFNKRLEHDSNYMNGHWFLFEIFVIKGMDADALSHWQKLFSIGSRLSPDFRYAAIAKGIDWSDLRSALRTVTNLTLRDSRSRYCSAWEIAWLYTLMDDRENAIRWLERAYSERDRNMWSLAIDPLMDEIRPDPRFQEILRKMNLDHVSRAPMPR